MQEHPYSSEAYLLAFQKLRKHVHKEMQDRLNARLDAGNWQPTDFELEIDAYEEEIEPQVLGAVKTLNQKGYKTASSGFYGTHSEYQAIDGPFTDSRRSR